jgi:hypothetical protein
MIRFILWMLVIVDILGALGKNEERPMRIIFALMALAAVVALIITPDVVR